MRIRKRGLTVLSVCAHTHISNVIKYDTPGRKKLEALGLGPSEIARAMGKDAEGREVSPSTASRWRSGDSRPDDVHQPVLEKLYGIPRSDWLTESEQKDLESRLATGAPQEPAA